MKSLLSATGFFTLTVCVAAPLALGADPDEPAGKGGGDSPPTQAPAQTEMQKWLATTDAPWQAAYKREVTDVYEADVAKLKVQYLAGLDAAVAKASAAGDLDGAVALRDEKQRFSEKNEIAPQDADAAAPSLKQVRAAMRAQLLRLEESRANRAKGLHAKYDQVLAQAQGQLTQRGRLDDALLVKARREELAKAWLSGGDATPAPKAEVALKAEDPGTPAKSTPVVSGELTIISATYTAVSGGRSSDVTGNIKHVFESGQPTLRLTTSLIGAKDPAPLKKKQTKITYVIGGQKKEKIFPESYTLNFKDDLN